MASVSAETDVCQPVCEHSKSDMTLQQATQHGTTALSLHSNGEGFCLHVLRLAKQLIDHAMLLVSFHQTCMATMLCAEQKDLPRVISWRMQWLVVTGGSPGWSWHACQKP